MSKVTINYFPEDARYDSVSFEGSTVAEALAMKAEYLLNVGVDTTEPTSSAPSAPATSSQSDFLARTRGGDK